MTFLVLAKKKKHLKKDAIQCLILYELLCIPSVGFQ